MGIRELNDHEYTVSEDDLALEYDFGGMSLRELALSAEPQQAVFELHHQRQSIGDCKPTPPV